MGLAFEWTKIKTILIVFNPLLTDNRYSSESKAASSTFFVYLVVFRIVFLFFLLSFYDRENIMQTARRAPITFASFYKLAESKTKRLRVTRVWVHVRHPRTSRAKSAAVRYFPHFSTRRGAAARRIVRRRSTIGVFGHDRGGGGHSV